MQKETGGDAIAHFFKACKRHNLKITPQRIAIYKELIKSRNHPSADKMFQIVRKEYPNISFDTVNRTLLKLSEIGLVDIVEGEGGPRRFDPNTDNHHHFHCIKCGQIIDFSCEEYEHLEIPENIQNTFTVLNQRVVLSGICENCGKKM